MNNHFDVILRLYRNEVPNHYFGPDSKLYHKAVDKFCDHIALLEQLIGIASEVNEDDMTLFIENEPTGGFATWFSFESYYHSKDAPERPFLHFFKQKVTAARVSKETIVYYPDLQNVS